MKELTDDLHFYEEEALSLLRKYYEDSEIQHHVNALANADSTTIKAMRTELQSKHPACADAVMLLFHIVRVKNWLSSESWQVADTNDISLFALECISIGAALGGIMHDGLMPFAEQGLKFRVEGPRTKRRQEDFMVKVIEMCRNETGRHPSTEEFYEKLEELSEGDEAGFRGIFIDHEDRTIEYQTSKGKTKSRSYKRVQNYLTDYKKHHPLPQDK